MSSFTMDFPFVSSVPEDEEILNRRYEYARCIYNDLIDLNQIRYEKMINLDKYKKLVNNLSKNKEDQKENNKTLERIRKANGFSASTFYMSYNTDINKVQYYYKEDYDIMAVRSIAKSLWNEYKKVLNNPDYKIEYKKFDTFNVIESNNQGCIHLINDCLDWYGLSIPIDIDRNNTCVKEAFENKIYLIRIVREVIETGYDYTLEIDFDGKKPDGLFSYV